MHVNINKIFII